MRAPPLLSMSRREVSMFMVLPSSGARRAHNGFDNAGVRPAATEIVCERFLHLRLSWFFVDGEERGGLHDHAIDAVPALNRLLLDEGALHRMGLLGRAQPFQCDNLLLG